MWPQETDYKLQHAQSLFSAGRYEDALRAANGITQGGYENKVLFESGLVSNEYNIFILYFSLGKI